MLITLFLYLCRRKKNVLNKKNKLTKSQINFKKFKQKLSFFYLKKKMKKSLIHKKTDQFSVCF